MPAITYFRLVHSTIEPGYVEKGTHARPKSSAAETSTSSTEESIGVYGQPTSTLNLEGIFKGDVAPPPGLSKFYNRDVFACDPNGLPIWCGTCANWKPDRTHHCSDVGRCVLKLDHFCPWVGGVVSEANFKFFIQFVTYTSIYTLYTMIVVSYFWADRSSHGYGVNGNWLALLVLSVLFTLFTAGMAGNSIHLALKNTTTIDNINHAARTMHLAVYIPNPQRYWRPTDPTSDPATSMVNVSTNAQTGPPPDRKTSPVSALYHTQNNPAPDRMTSPVSALDPQYQPSTHNAPAPPPQSGNHRPPLPPSIHSVDKTGFEKGECVRLMFKGSTPKAPISIPTSTSTPQQQQQQLPHPWEGTITYPLYTTTPTTTSGTVAPPPRTFAILRTRPGMNPWDLGAGMNWRQVMGHSIWDWLVPLRRSPCASHTDIRSFYPLGRDVERLKEEAGLLGGRNKMGLENEKVWGGSGGEGASEESLGDLVGGPNGSTLAIVDGHSGRERGGGSEAGWE